MRKTVVAALTFLALSAPAVAQDDQGGEGPLSHPDFVARWNRFGGNMEVTGDQTCRSADCGFRTPWVTSDSRVLVDYLWARTSAPATKTRNAHRFQLRSPDGQPVTGARFVLRLPRLRTMAALDQKSDEAGRLGIRLRKPRVQHDLFILADGYAPVRYTMSGGKLRSADHTIHLQPAPQAEGPPDLVELSYSPEQGNP